MLLVDDNPSILNHFRFLLQKAGFIVDVAMTASAALAAARTGFDVMLLDVRLGADDGLEVLRRIRQDGISGHVIVTTGFDVEGIETQAKQLGADFVDRWTLPDPVDLISTTLVKRATEPTRHDLFAPPGLSQWVDAVMTGLEARKDPRTVAEWAHSIAKSDGSLRGLCQLLGISAKASCTLVRVLRAVRLANRSGRIRPAEWLRAGDRRTVKRLLDEAGIADDCRASIDTVLSRQQLIKNDAAISLLSRALRRARYW